MMQKKSQKNYNQSKSLLYQIKPNFEKNIKKGLIDYIRGDNWITEYKFTEKFEKKFAKFTNSKHCICFPNGTITMSAVLDCLNFTKCFLFLVLLVFKNLGCLQCHFTAFLVKLKFEILALA